MTNVLSTLRGLLDKFPKPLRVAFWIGASAAVTAIYNAYQTGAFVPSPEWMPFVNFVLVTADWYIQKRKQDGA